jgi:hypothetical protein
MALWSRIRTLLSGPSKRDPRIGLVDGGLDVFSSETGHVVASVRWQNVLRVHTYKVDLATTDCICLTFEFNNGMAPVRVSEEWVGFAELFEPLAAAFPTIPPEWYADVMTPAFKANHRVLYDASPSHSAASV